MLCAHKNPRAARLESGKDFERSARTGGGTVSATGRGRASVSSLAVGCIAMGAFSAPSKKQALMPGFVGSPCWGVKDVPSSASLPFAPCSVQL